jgi:Flp pilus assembly protein TadD
LIHQLPQDYTAWNLKGLSYIELKQYDSAKICFQQAVKLNPDEAHFYSNWAKAYVGLGDFDKATRLYSTAILLDDAQPNFYINRSICYDQLGIEDKAREDFKKAQSLNPNNPLLKQNKTIVQKYATKSWIKFIMFSGILLGIMILITILRKKQWNHENN